MGVRTWRLCSSLLFVLMSASAEQTTVTAEPGQNVTLTGRAPNNNNPILIVEWSRADLAGENVLFYRDEQLDPEDQHPSFRNRVELQDKQMKGGDVSLILKNVTVNDTGTYECRIFIRGANRRRRANLNSNPISIIYLSVVAPPGPTGGTTEDGGKKDGGKEDGGKEDAGSVGLIVGLIVPALLLLVAAAGFWIYRKSKEQKQDPYEPPAELQPV